MATVKCSACETEHSITFCSETGLPLCGTCGIPCDACDIPISVKRAQVTSTGRRLCAKCMAERNARRRAKRDKIKEREKAKQNPWPAAPPEPAKVPKTVGGAAAAGGTSFEDIYSGSDLDHDVPASAKARPSRTPKAPAPQPKGVPASTSFEDLDSGADFEPAAGGQAFGEVPEETDEDGRPKRDFGLEGVPTETSGRLELPPIDENRPVLTRSGYSGPSKTAYALAFIFFGVAGVIFYSTTPILKDIMFPFDTPEFEFQADQMPSIQENNRLRNTSNISQLDLFSQTPIFFVTWLLLIIYLGGCARIIFSVGYSLSSSFLAKRRLRRIEKKYGGKDPFSNLG